ncbi:MAG TPA: hypothetical protein VND93_33635, partial [Myxococcales bacterium]|nr:hypothetical protein [Myxococcales bacterium]
MRPLLPLLLLWVAAPAGAQENGRPVLFHTPARQIAANEPYTVEGLLIDGKRIDKLYLRYRTLGEAYRTLEMEAQYGDVFRALIPARFVSPPAMEYYV